MKLRAPLRRRLRLRVGSKKKIIFFFINFKFKIDR